MPKRQPRIKLTERIVEKAKTDKDERWLMDSEIRGFGVRVRGNGKKSYAIRWKDVASRDRKKTMADTTQITLEGARRLAQQWLGEIVMGNEPGYEAKMKERAQFTVRELGQEVTDHLKSLGRSASYIRDIEGYLRNHINPAIGDALVKDVSTIQLTRLINSLQAKPRTAEYVRQVLARMFKLAAQWGRRFDNPTEGLERRQTSAKERYLSEEEIKRLAQTLNDLPDSRQQSADAIRLLLFTGARSKEVLSARWSQFNLNSGTWEKPAMATKQKRMHRVELSEYALTVLQRLKERAEHRRHAYGEQVSEFVFPSNSKSGHLTTLKTIWNRVRKEADIEDVTPHDLRRTFATKLVAQGTDWRTVMSLTGHTTVNVLMKNYAQFSPQKQREAVDGLFEL